MSEQNRRCTTDSWPTCSYRQSIIIRTEAEEKEEGCQPHANAEERRDLRETMRALEWLICPVSPGWGMSSFLRGSREIKEPQEMVCDDEDAGTDERNRRQGYDRPCIGEVLQIDDVAEHREDCVSEGQRLGEIQHAVQRDDDLQIVSRQSTSKHDTLT